jgi:hypothetical protein
MFGAIRKIGQQAIVAAQNTTNQINPNLQQQQQAQYEAYPYNVHTQGYGYGQPRPQGQMQYQQPGLPNSATPVMQQAAYNYGQPGAQSQPIQYAPHVGYQSVNPYAQPQIGTPLPSGLPQHSGMPGISGTVPVYAPGFAIGAYGQAPIVLPPAFTWGSLITADKKASSIFNRLIDSIFYLADSLAAPQKTGYLEPAKAAVLYEALGYAKSNNIPNSLLQFATENRFPNPRATQNEAMEMNWRISGFPFVSTASGPGLTREGFRATILMDTLIDPVTQLKRFNYFIGHNHTNLLDPETGLPFPLAVIPSESLPTVGDPVAQDLQRQKNAAFQAEFLQYQQILGRVQNQTHFSTMTAMTAGYYVPNTSGGYNYHHTGGMTW